ncbi:hypothetical protein ACHAWF_016713 [Thalassiosira exigua]
MPSPTPTIPTRPPADHSADRPAVDVAAEAPGSSSRDARRPQFDRQLTAETERHFNTARTPRHCNSRRDKYGPEESERRSSPVPGEEDDDDDEGEESAGAPGRTPHPRGRGPRPAHPPQQQARRLPATHHPPPPPQGGYYYDGGGYAYQGGGGGHYPGGYPESPSHHGAPPYRDSYYGGGGGSYGYHHGHHHGGGSSSSEPPQVHDPRYARRVRYHPPSHHHHDPRYSQGYGPPPPPHYDPYYDHADPYRRSAGRPPPHESYDSPDRRHPRPPSRDLPSSESKRRPYEDEDGPRPSAPPGKPPPPASGGGGEDQGSLHAVSSSFSDGKSLKSARAGGEGEEKARATEAGGTAAANNDAHNGAVAAAVKQSPGVVTQGGSVEGSVDKAVPSQPSLKSAGSDEASATSDSSWRQLHQIASVEKEDMLRLEISKSELTSATSDHGPPKKEAKERSQPDKERGGKGGEGGAAAAAAVEQASSPGDLRAAPSGTSSLSNSPTDEERRLAEAEEHEGRGGGDDGGRRRYLPDAPHPPPSRHPYHQHRPSQLAPGSGGGFSVVPQAGHERDPNDDHDSPSASTISTKASLAAQALGFFRDQPAPGTQQRGAAQAPDMKPKHPVHVKKSREGSISNDEGHGDETEPRPGQEAKRRKLAGGETSSPPKRMYHPLRGPSPAEGSAASDPAAHARRPSSGHHHAALDGRVMAASPEGHGSLELGAVPSWDTAGGRPFATGWSVCSGITEMGSLGRDGGGSLAGGRDEHGGLSAFSFSEGFGSRPDHHRRGVEEGEAPEGGVPAGSTSDRGEEEEEEDQDPSPKSILSKVGERRKGLAPGTHVQFSREPGHFPGEGSAGRGPRKRSHGATAAARVPIHAPSSAQDDYYYDHPRHHHHAPVHPYDYPSHGAARPGPPPPGAARHLREHAYYPEEDPYYEHYYGAAPHHHPPYGHPPHARHGNGRLRGQPPPPHYLDYPPPHHRAADGRMQSVSPVNTPPSGRGGHHPSHHHHHQPPHPHVSSQFSHPRSEGGVVRSGGWDRDDDMALMKIMNKFKNARSHWDAIAKKLDRGRTPDECKDRWNKHLKPGSRKGQWTDEEDAIVAAAVRNSHEDPFTRWSDLAHKLPGRVGKQVRDRWVNHLNPAINHLPFSREDVSRAFRSFVSLRTCRLGADFRLAFLPEALTGCCARLPNRPRSKDLLLWEGHHVLGKRWVEISSKYFKGSRSENHIKNRWYSASFKKFIAKEFGEEAYRLGNDNAGAGGSVKKAAAVAPAIHSRNNGDALTGFHEEGETI